jgi:branched-subunit amino acid transport protein
MEMINQSNYLLIIFGMLSVTYLPRVVPLLFLSKWTLPEPLLAFLSLIPITILGALLIPMLLVNDNQLDISFNNTYLIVGCLTCLVALKTKKLGIIVVFGMVAMAVLRSIIS